LAGSKKAYAMRALITIILASVLFFIFVKFSNLFAGEIDKGQVKEGCRLSVISNAEVRDPFFEGQRVPIDCPRIDEEITLDEIKPTRWEDESERVMRIMAENSRDCYYKMGEGDFVPFESSWWTNNNLFCITCSEIRFDDKVKKELHNPTGHDIIGFFDYLYNKTMEDDERTYFEYFTDSTYVEEDLEEMLLGDASIIDVSKDYYTLFVFLKKGEVAKLIGTATGGTVGGLLAAGVLVIIPLPGSRVAAAGVAVTAVGLGAGAGSIGGFALGKMVEGYDPAVLLVPKDKLPTLGCDYFYNLKDKRTYVT